MKPDQSIEIQLVNGNGEAVALGNVMIDLYFYANGNFRYGFGVGRTDDSGCLTVFYSHVEAIRKKNAEFDVMDYNTELDDCDPRVEVVIDTEEGLRKRYDNVLRSYKKPPAWADNWPSNARVRGRRISVELTGKVTRVEIPIQ